MAFIRVGSLQESSRVLKDAARWLDDGATPMWSSEDLEPAELARVHPDCLPLLAVSRDGPVATVLVCWSDPLMWPEAAPDEAGYIHKLAVTEAYRGSGMASELFAEAEDRCRRRGLRLARLDCSANRPKLVQWYLERGYEAVDRRTVGPHDCLFLEKEL